MGVGLCTTTGNLNDRRLPPTVEPSIALKYENLTAIQTGPVDERRNTARRAAYAAKPAIYETAVENCPSGPNRPRRRTRKTSQEHATAVVDLLRLFFLFLFFASWSASRRRVTARRRAP